jgi:hypothetical protein
MEEVYKTYNFELINGNKYAEIASSYHAYKINLHLAMHLIDKYKIKVYRCSIKANYGEEFDAFIVDLTHSSLNLIFQKHCVINLRENL